MIKQQQQLEKAKKEKDDEEDRRTKEEHKRKALNLENQKLQTEMEELQKSHHQSTIEVENEYAVKFDEKLRGEEKYKQQLQQYENDKKKLENIYNLNIQQRENENQKIQQAYNSLVIEIEKQKNLFTINQTEILNKSILLDNLKKQYIILQNQNMQNKIEQKNLFSKLEQEQSKLEQEKLHKENIEKENRDLLMEMEERKKENINLKSKYDTDIENFKNELEQKRKEIQLEEIQNQNVRKDLLSELEQEKQRLK
jgi:hypothetical protein